MTLRTSVCLVAAVLMAIPWGFSGIPPCVSVDVGGASAQSRPPVPPPAVTLSEDTPSLEEVLEGYVEAAGGREAFEKLATRAATGRVITDLPTWNPPRYEVDSLAVYSKPPDGYLIVWKSEGGATLEGLDGDGHWKRDASGQVSAVEGADPRKACYADPQFPIRLGEYFPEMTLLGTATLDGRRAHVVDVDGEHSHRLYFDAESHLLLRLGYNTRLLDYRELDGVMVPFAVEHSRKGGSTTVFMDSVVHNEPLDDGLFTRPE